MGKVKESFLLMFLSSVLLIISVGCYALRSRITIILHNCIPGKTLYPRIYSSNMAGQPAGNNVIKGPPINAKLGTCGQSATLTSSYEDRGYGNIYNGVHGIVIITGLNGGSLIYQKNNYKGNAPYYPNKSTILPYHGTDWLYGDWGGLGFISNQHYKNLPSGISCPSGTEHDGPVCIGYNNNYNWSAVLRDVTFTVYIYPPYESSQVNSLPDLPSSL